MATPARRSRSRSHEMRALIGLVFVVACSDDVQRSSITCPPGTQHKGIYLRGEFCELPNGKKHGPERYYHANSRVVMHEGTWEGGKKNGRWTHRYENGAIAWAGDYRANK